MTQPRTVCVIDASSFIHRAFHAMPYLATRAGVPTGAVFGFTRILLSILKAKPEARIVIAYDSRGPNFRHRIDPEYKANRPPMDPDLAAQIPIIKELVAALGLTTFEDPDYEADDIIGTVTRLSQEAGQEVIIASGDKDLLQLVGEQVVMWDPSKDKITDPAGVVEKYGVGPEKLPDAFGLIGDTSDNIPGVPGIGPKIAGQLINEYGDLESLLNRAEEIKQPKRRQNLIEHAEAARMSKRLFLLETGMDLDFDPEAEAEVVRDEDRLVQLLGDLEMDSLIPEISPAGSRESAQATSVDLLTGIEGLEKVLQTCRETGVLALDLTVGQGRVLWEEDWCLALGAGQYGVCIDLNDSFGRDLVAAALADPEVAKVGFGLKPAKVRLARTKLSLEGPLRDLAVADYLLNPARRNRDPQTLVTEYLGRTVELDDPAEKLAAALGIWAKTHDELKKTGVDTVYDRIEVPLLPVLAEMEATGVVLDLDLLKAYSAELEARIKELYGLIIEAAGHEFNPNSPQQLGQVLFDELGLPQAGKTAKKTGYSTSVKVLEGLQDLHPLPGLILENRSLTKLKSTYVDALINQVDPETGRIHTTFNQAVAATGRLSSSDPNLQNIPIRTEEGRRIRAAFAAPRGHLLLSADYSQIELRLLAHYCRDPVLLEAFNAGRDIHTETAARVFEVFPDLVDAEMRRRAKIVNFSLIYGKTAYGLAVDLGISRKEAADFIDSYFARFPKIREFWDKAVAECREQGFVTTLWGRKRYLPEVRAKNRMAREAAERMAVNTIFQGSAADLIKVAMINLDKALKESPLQARMLLQVHDELILEVPQEEMEETAELVRQTMETAGELDVPLTVGLDWGRNWDEAH